MNCTPFVRQYDIMSNRWGDFNAKGSTKSADASGEGHPAEHEPQGNCLDNAVIENFFGLLKSELLYLQESQSMQHFKQKLIEYPDYYNNRRIKAKQKGLPPAIHRQQALSAA